MNMNKMNIVEKYTQKNQYIWICSNNTLIIVSFQGQFFSSSLVLPISVPLYEMFREMFFSRQFATVIASLSF